MEEVTLEGVVLRTLKLVSVVDRDVTLGASIITRQVSSLDSLSEMEYFPDE